MTFTVVKTEPAAARPVPPLLYPTLLIAGIGVIIASMLGIAAITGLLPQAQSQVIGKLPEKAAAQASAKSATVAGAARCADCGVVDTIRAIEVKGQGSGVGAVAGGLVGGILGNQVGGGSGRTAMTVVGVGAYAGHEVEKNVNKSVSYEVRVRMDDDSYRTFRVRQPEVGVGQRVQVRDGRIVRAG